METGEPFFTFKRRTNRMGYVAELAVQAAESAVTPEAQNLLLDAAELVRRAREQEGLFRITDPTESTNQI